MSLQLENPGKFEKQRQAWEKIRERGKLHFVLTRGSLGWGGFMFIFMTCMSFFVDHKKPDLFLPISALFWLLAGYPFGLWLWRWCEERYHSPTNKPPSIISN
jgi:hypothetical protein